jgi:hypothetical protein
VCVSCNDEFDYIALSNFDYKRIAMSITFDI